MTASRYPLGENAASPGTRCVSSGGWNGIRYRSRSLPGKHRAQIAVLLFGQVIAVQFVIVQAGHLEMKVIDHHMVDARFGDELRQMGLPDPLGEPHAAGVVSELRVGCNAESVRIWPILSSSGSTARIGS